MHGKSFTLEDGAVPAHIPKMATIVRCNCGAEYERTEAKFLMPHTGHASCEVCGAVLESCWKAPTLPYSGWSTSRRKAGRIFVGWHLAPPLTHEEFVFMRDCAKGLMHRAIPAEHKDRLIQLGEHTGMSGATSTNETLAGLRIVEGE